MIWCIYIYANIIYIHHTIHCNTLLRKPAGRLGKVVLANKVSIGGLGGGRCRGPRSSKLGGEEAVQMEVFFFFWGGRHVPLGKV